MDIRCTVQTGDFAELLVHLDLWSCNSISLYYSDTRIPDFVDTVSDKLHAFFY